MRVEIKDYVPKNPLEMYLYIEFYGTNKINRPRVVGLLTGAEQSIQPWSTQNK